MTSTSVTIYRLDASLGETVDFSPSEKLRACLDEKELTKWMLIHDGLIWLPAPTNSAYKAAYLVVGERISQQKSNWVTSLEELVGRSLAVDTSRISNAAVLLLESAKDPNCVWALTFAQGYSLLNDRLRMVDFGKLFVLDHVDGERVKTVATSSFANRAKTSNVSYPGATSYWMFPVQPLTDLIKSIAGVAVAGSGRITISGSHRLRFPIDLSPETLLSDIDQLEKMIEAPKQSALSESQLIKPLGNARSDVGRSLYLYGIFNEVILNLVADIKSDEDVNSAIDVVWPFENLDADPYDYTYVFRTPFREVSRSSSPPTLETIKQWGLEVLKEGHRNFDEIAREKLVSCISDEGERRTFRPIDFISVLYKSGGTQYLLSAGYWYRLSPKFNSNLDTLIKPFIVKTPKLAGKNLPVWTNRYHDEGCYNSSLAEQMGDQVLCLDKQLIYASGDGDLRKSKFEIADIVSTGGVILHTKRFSSSSTQISHLSNQVASAITVLNGDTSAEGAMRNLIKRKAKKQQRSTVEKNQKCTIFLKARTAHFDDSALVDNRVRKFVAAIISQTPIEELPVLSKIALASLITIARREGSILELWHIPVQ